MNKYIIGSQYFFSCYPDFTSKDIDEIQIIETNEFSHMRQITGQGRCLFQLKKYPSKEEYINWDLYANLGMAVGKYLIPEFCNQIGFTVEDLPKVKSLLTKLDDKHKYEEIIYNSYITNGSFTLTQEQRDEAYKLYKESRGV